MIDVSNIFLPHPNPPLIKGREPDFSYFPPLQGGTKGGNNVIKIIAKYFSNILLEEFGILLLNKKIQAEIKISFACLIILDKFNK
ncbi:MAG: hypothetical protein V7K98_20335 [Nostoc sp.]|uniref:hypothetical protein n=1 Tax=Nostoc sp. TaxID=1180 RepID=UPI002FF88A52